MRWRASWPFGSLVTVAFGYGGLALLGSGVTPLYLPAPGDDDDEISGRRATYAQSLRPFEQNAYAFVSERHAVDETSASLRWVYAAADLGLFAARAGLISPTVHESLSPETTALLNRCRTTLGGSLAAASQYRARPSHHFARRSGSAGAMGPLCRRRAIGSRPRCHRALRRRRRSLGSGGRGLAAGPRSIQSGRHGGRPPGHRGPTG